jgi:hypothetical protein
VDFLDSSLLLFFRKLLQRRIHDLRNFSGGLLLPSEFAFGSHLEYFRPYPAAKLRLRTLLIIHPVQKLAQNQSIRGFNRNGASPNFQVVPYLCRWAVISFACHYTDLSLPLLQNRGVTPSDFRITSAILGGREYSPIPSSARRAHLVREESIL